MGWVILTLAILFILGVLVLILCALKVGAEADSDNYQPREEKEDMYIATCEYCHKMFNTTENDALVKYQYGTKYIVHCPHCDKLTKITRDRY